MLGDMPANLTDHVWTIDELDTQADLAPRYLVVLPGKTNALSNQLIARVQLYNWPHRDLATLNCSVENIA